MGIARATTASDEGRRARVVRARARRRSSRDGARRARVDPRVSRARAATRDERDMTRAREDADEARARRHRRLAANREASAASRRRKRELECEMRARVDALEELVRALVAENAALRGAVLGAACPGAAAAASGAAKLPLPRLGWENATGCAVGVDLSTSSPASSLTATNDVGRSETGRLASAVERGSSDASANEYTGFVPRTKRSDLEHVVRAIEDAKKLARSERRRVGEGPLAATCSNEPCAENNNRAIHMLFANALARISTSSATYPTSSQKTTSLAISRRFSTTRASTRSWASMRKLTSRTRSWRASRKALQLQSMKKKISGPV